MAYTDIDKPDDYFNTVLYTGNASSRSITGVNFQPDWVWIKRRSTGDAHYSFDGVRGATKYINPNNTDAEITNANTLTSFDSDGFSLGTVNETNKSGETFVSWNWLASNSTASNTDGSITSTVSANTTSGFSIVSYTGNGSAGATVGHGLGSKPKVIIVKIRSTTDHWIFYNEDSGATKNLRLDTTDSLITASGPFNNTEPTSSLFTLGSGSATNTNSATFIAYCFAEKKGFSKFGSYFGNGSSNGTYVYTGFKPALVVVKRIDSADDWVMVDNQRIGYNPNNRFLYSNSTSAEETLNDRFDLVSNGFKLRNSWSKINASGGDYVYMAFAENPFVTSTGIPACAR